MSDNYVSADPVKEELFSDEKGKYSIVRKTRELPRKTYLIGTLSGKYWGELDAKKEEEFQHSKFYDFHIYEAEVTEAEISNKEFYFEPDSGFPRERLPQVLPIILKKDGREYAVNILEPKIGNVEFIYSLHQTEGNEVFGTIKARITGYLLDFITEEYNEKVYVQEQPSVVYKSVAATPVLTKTGTPTGNTEFENGYERIEYYYSDYKSRYWGAWNYTKPAKVSSAEGCLGGVAGIFGIIIGIAFLLLLLPRIAILIPFLLLPFIIGIIPQSAWTWIFRIIGGILLAGFIIAVVSLITTVPKTYVPKPLVQDRPEEQASQLNPIVDTVNHLKVNDTLITHFRSWKDYNGKVYEGKFWVKKSDLICATNYKNNLSISEKTERDYDNIIYSLKENDKDHLQGIYQLFDSIKTANHLTSEDFAEMTVAFVQDIPYAVVLPNGCDPNLYNDDFIRKYLSLKDAKCVGYERFGINTPVEFLASLQGDCDTRTLLIYTILSHYGYDVALLSSEYYNHSLIGINLPYDGIAYKFNDQRYVLWETTAPDIRPGVLPNEIANTDYWRISLKSK